VIGSRSLGIESRRLLYLAKTRFDSRRHGSPELNAMMQSTPTMAQQIAQAATAFQEQRTGHTPKSVSVVLSGDTLVVTLHGALSPAEQAMALNPEGAAKVREFHRQLFHNASDALRQEIKRITGMDVREATAEVEPISGAVVQVFSTGTMVQVFQLSGNVPSGTFDAVKT
jgi:uncharacterized protein YbcI